MAQDLLAGVEILVITLVQNHLDVIQREEPRNLANIRLQALSVGYVGAAHGRSSNIS